MRREQCKAWGGEESGEEEVKMEREEWKRWRELWFHHAGLSSNVYHCMLTTFGKPNPYNTPTPSREADQP